MSLNETKLTEYILDNRRGFVFCLFASSWGLFFCGGRVQETRFFIISIGLLGSLLACLIVFYGISTPVGYLKPNAVLNIYQIYMINKQILYTSQSSFVCT